MFRRRLYFFIILFLLILVTPTFAHASNITVYITDYGTKYHEYGCSYLRSINEISLEDAVSIGKTPCSRCDPPIYVDYESENISNNPTSPKVVPEDVSEAVNTIKNAPVVFIENAKSFFLQNQHYFFSAIIILIWFRYTGKNIYKDIKRSRNNQTSSTTNAEFANYYSLYAGKDPMEFVHPPNGVFLVDGLPATDNRLKYGLYSVYITPKGTRYHRRKKCANSNNAQLTNLYLVHKRMHPCKMCCQRYNPNMDFEWYEKYLEIKRIKKKYDIP